ncbi:MAG: Phosphoribosylformylglycinamidine synthase 2 [candidate division BRC1 bacterium ADurb.BinA364]|nr:MAG: Phosphoribosylformylglycinamidine synthase 2 [candidate division BRC1 bacterium ADurb.BinA364]
MPLHPIDQTRITPEIVADHGLSPEEWTNVLEILGREPTFPELGVFSVMWSEHCSYKNSKPLLKTLPTAGPMVLQGPGENAGAVSIGDGKAVVFKIESHNHPSAVEPYEGAATGVGGILRDIFTMGARPIAMLDSLRFGSPDAPRTAYLARGVVSGIADYGNCVGIPTVAGEIGYSESYEGNPLVNAMCVGLAEEKDLTLASADRPGLLVVYFGNSTGRDGIHGATFASEELTEETMEQRSAVQVGDPFMGKKILEATLDLIQAGAVEGIQDMGAAGLTCSSCEMAGRGGTGVEIDLDKVPQRAENLAAYELLLSESQERMLAVCEEEKIDLARRILAKWDLEAHVLGRTTGDGRMRVFHRGRQVVDIPAARISEESPVYRREARRPAYLDSLDMFTEASYEEPTDYHAELLRVLSLPTVASKRWAYEQYDYMVQTNTVARPGASAAVVRVRGTDKHLALTTDCNGIFCFLDPYEGGKMAVAEAALNVACTGARPWAITNCLNFGNPMKPEIFWQFSGAVRGMGDACRALGTPVTGGNVSFYNESDRGAVFPTPVIGMLGLIAPPSRPTRAGWAQAGDSILLAGPAPTTLGGSQALNGMTSRPAGPCPRIDLDLHKRLIDALLEAIEAGLAHSAHDVSEGGLAVALAECCLASDWGGLGADIVLGQGVRRDIALFGEDPSRVVLTTGCEGVLKIEDIFAKANVPLIKIGAVGAAGLRIEGAASWKAAELAEAYEKTPF